MYICHCTVMNDNMRAKYEDIGSDMCYRVRPCLGRWH
ncbi:hypothetical protein F383_25808 [Gossypium arboreum]|uniref:Uncharacterized protein n=1 Tax=Gossypium arboreum TaxID=29729 RepID=A0A0B0P3K0_GOSAR|nr:hypothetical protein F383_25808 [Gossypium arboreum]